MREDAERRKGVEQAVDEEDEEEEGEGDEDADEEMSGEGDGGGEPGETDTETGRSAPSVEGSRSSVAPSEAITMRSAAKSVREGMDED